MSQSQHRGDWTIFPDSQYIWSRTPKRDTKPARFVQYIWSRRRTCTPNRDTKPAGAGFTQYIWSRTPRRGAKPARVTQYIWSRTPRRGTKPARFTQYIWSRALSQKRHQTANPRTFKSDLTDTLLSNGLYCFCLTTWELRPLLPISRSSAGMIIAAT